MTIIRNGVEIELTSEEIEQAYRERHRYYNGEDVKMHWVDMSDNGEDFPGTDEDALAIGERADEIMDHNDGYWDYYWACFEAAINEYKEEM